MAVKIKRCLFSFYCNNQLQRFAWFCEITDDEHFWIWTAPPGSALNLFRICARLDSKNKLFGLYETNFRNLIEQTPLSLVALLECTPLIEAGENHMALGAKSPPLWNAWKKSVPLDAERNPVSLGCKEISAKWMKNECSYHWMRKICVIDSLDA